MERAGETMTEDVICCSVGNFLPAPLLFLTGRAGYYASHLFLPTKPDMMLHAGLMFLGGS